MYKKLLILLLVVALCLAEDGSGEARRRRKGIKKHHFFHNGYYYLAFIAVKAKIAFLIASMISFWLFAGKLFAYLQYTKKEEPQKIYVQSDPHPTVYPSFASPDFHGSDYSDRYGRSFENSVYDGLDLFKNAMKRIDLNEFAFDSLDLKEDSCRKKFICEANFRAKTNSFLKFAMTVFGDPHLHKYKTLSPLNTIEDCGRIYQDCLDNSVDGVD